MGQGLNTVLTIEIDCTGAGTSPCIIVNAGNTGMFLVMIIQGLVVNRSADAAISVLGDAVYVVGNVIGTDPSGNIPPGAQRLGIGIGAHDVVIGGTTPFERNLVSGAEVGIIGGPDSLVVIAGNLIGTNAAGTSALPSEFGIQLTGNATIGGATASHRNVVSGNLVGIAGAEVGQMAVFVVKTFRLP